MITLIIPKWILFILIVICVILCIYYSSYTHLQSISNKDDVLKIAKAITEDPIIHADYQSIAFYYCRYCQNKIYSYPSSTEEFKHKPDCPVLIAKRILGE